MRDRRLGEQLVGTPERTCRRELRDLGVGSGKESRSLRSELFVAGHQRCALQPVLQNRSSCGGPTRRAVSKRPQVGVLRPHSPDETHPAAEGVAPAYVHNVVVDLATRDVRKTKYLKGLDERNLIVPVDEVTVPGFNRGLVTVQQTVGVVKNVRIAECSDYREGRSWGDGLHHVEDRLDRKSTRLNSSHRCISYAVF